MRPHVALHCASRVHGHVLLPFLAVSATRQSDMTIACTHSCDALSAIYAQRQEEKTEAGARPSRSLSLCALDLLRLRLRYESDGRHKRMIGEQPRAWRVRSYAASDNLRLDARYCVETVNLRLHVSWALSTGSRMRMMRTRCAWSRLLTALPV
ncbi:hypothetical protein DE146DRAFT_99566 [Phaeosphaeria sp. MPI-PUGE-AT-0046c]|nr:hypothetical protein DE146DRAFT_99566 [Phaeosphaeria sp. MPI-PUGE-AT-0046c]